MARRCFRDAFVRKAASKNEPPRTCGSIGMEKKLMLPLASHPAAIVVCVEKGGLKPVRHEWLPNGLARIFFVREIETERDREIERTIV